MYVMLNEVILVHQEVYRPRPNDVPVYHRNYRGEDIFTLDNEPSRYATEPIRYGLIYADADERLCIVPDTWDENHAMRARMEVVPQDYYE